MLAEHATLRPGQHLTARLATRELRIDESGTERTSQGSPTGPDASIGEADRRQREWRTPEDGGPDADRAAARAPPGAVARRGAATAEAPAAAGRASPGPARAVQKRPRAPWQSRTRRRSPTGRPRTGRRASRPVTTAGVVAEAVAHGIDAVVAEADGPALVALADAARYVGPKLPGRACAARAANPLPRHAGRGRGGVLPGAPGRRSWRGGGGARLVPPLPGRGAARRLRRRGARPRDARRGARSPAGRRRASWPATTSTASPTAPTCFTPRLFFKLR